MAFYRYLLPAISLLTLPALAELRVKFEGDARLSKLDGSGVRSIKAGETLALDSNEPLMVSTGTQPLVLLPISASEKEISIRASYDESLQFDPRLEATLSTLLTNVKRVEGLVAAQKPEQALKQLEPLLHKYPQLAYLYFIQGSCYVLMKNKGQAAQALRAGLQLQPDNEEGQKMLQLIEGTKR